MITKKIAIASDHAGVFLKSSIVDALHSMGAEVLDLGTNTNESVDYPDYAAKLARSVIDGNAEMGVLICGTGIGISIAANRYKELRAALCYSKISTEMSRRHNDANVLVLGANAIDKVQAIEYMKIFFTTNFDGDKPEGERHQKRVAKLS